MKFSIFLIINSFLIFHDGELPVNKSNEEGYKKHHRDISYCEKLFINSSKKIRKISFIPEARCSASTDYLNYISDRREVVSFFEKMEFRFARKSFYLLRGTRTSCSREQYFFRVATCFFYFKKRYSEFCSRILA